MPQAQVSAELRAQIHQLDQSRCAYCHTLVSLSIATFEIDHIIPQSVGGETIVDNLCLACPPCNRYKGTKQQAIDPDTEQWVPLYHPRRQIWPVHFTWNDDWTVLIGLTPIGRVTITALRMNRPQMIRLRGTWKKSGLVYFP